MTDRRKIDEAIDYYVDNYTETAVLMLLQAVSHPTQGGLGYRIESDNIYDIDGYRVDDERRIITLDEESVVSSYDAPDIAEELKDAIEIEVFESRRSLAYRIGWGSATTLAGIVEIAVGVVGIVVPEPATTAMGLGLTVMGANSVVDGVSQIAGANNGDGVNLLAAGAGRLGSSVADAVGGDADIGRVVGEVTFAVASIAVGTFGSIKILRIPGRSMVRMGVGGRPGGVTIGRVDAMYPSENVRDSLTILSINDNANHSILRFVVLGGRLYVNGRIYGAPYGNILRHESDWKTVVKGLLKLLWHGAKSGW